MFDQLAEGRPRDIKIERSRCMMLHPLAEIVVGVFMAVSVGGGQFMVHVLRNGEGRQGHEQEDEADRQASSYAIYDVRRQHCGGRSTTNRRSLSNKAHAQLKFHLTLQQVKYRHVDFSGVFIYPGSAGET